MKRISFRDPQGFVLEINRKLYRIVFKSFKNELEIIIKNNLFIHFSKHQLLEKSEYPPEIWKYLNDQELDDLLAIFKLEELPVISYPWEWTPEMLREAAVHTLDIFQELLKYRLILKDASFFNIQFINGKPVFIDLLSIKNTSSVYPWYAYGQFLRHFINPLILIKYKRFNDLSFLSSFLDGVPTQLIKSQLPCRSYMNVYELLNVRLLGSLGKKNQSSKFTSKLNQDTQINRLIQLISFNKDYLTALISHFEESYKNSGTWLDYYIKDVDQSYYLTKKEALITIFDRLPDSLSATDLGANTGEYSEIAIKYVSKLISVEQDVYCAEKISTKINNTVLKDKKWNVIQNDLFMPTANLGWNNNERQTLKNRIEADITMCLALIHHLYFKGSIYFDEIVEFLNSITIKYLVIEFIEPDDDKIKLIARPDLDRFKQYDRSNFETELNKAFKIKKNYKLSDTRTLYHCEKI